MLEMVSTPSWPSQKQDHRVHAVVHLFKKSHVLSLQELAFLALPRSLRHVLLMGPKLPGCALKVPRWTAALLTAEGAHPACLLTLLALCSSLCLASPQSCLSAMEKIGFFTPPACFDGLKVAW